MKKVVLLVLVAVLCVAAFTACSAPAEESSAPAAESSSQPAAESSEPAAESSAAPAEGDGEYTIAYILPDTANKYYTTIADGIQAAAEEAGNVRVDVFDSQNDSAKQLNLAEDAIANKVDAVMITPYDTDIGTAVTEACVAANMPVFIIETGAEGDYNAYLSSDNYQGGYMAGEYVAGLMDAGELNIAELQGILARLVPAQRGVGFNEALKDNGIETPVPHVSSANFDRAEGMALMEDFLTSDNTINVVFCWNDEMALGAKEAIDARGLSDQIKIVGYDATAEAVQAIIDGEMVASVAQNPYEEGKAAVGLFLKEMKGESYEKDVLFPCVMVTSENAAEYLASIGG